MLDELDFGRPIRLALLRNVNDDKDLRGKSPAELADLLYDAGVLEELAALVSDAFLLDG